MVTKHELQEQWKAWLNKALQSVVQSAAAAGLGLLGADVGSTWLETGEAGAQLSPKAYVCGIAVAALVGLWRHFQTGIPDLFVVDDDVTAR
jgi:hypothetical protein